MTTNKNDIYIDVKGQSEDALQQKCIFFFWNEYPHLRKLLFAVPNGGLRGGKNAKVLQMTGVVSGVSDLILLYQGKAYLIELKRDFNSTQSKAQREWQEIVERQGFNYFIIRSLTEFKSLIKAIIT